MSDELKTTILHGYKTRYNEESRRGMEHLLNDLQASEVKPLFEYAKRESSADFEDDNEGQFSILYNKGDFTYTIIRRKY